MTLLRRPGPRFAAGAAVLLLLGVGAGWAGLTRLRVGPALGEGTWTLPGLDGPVEVLRDARGIPHVFAASREDAFRAQGWLHASDRLWQMEMLRRVASGRLSEAFGEATLDADRFLRTVGMDRAAAAGAAALDPATRRSLEAYAQGAGAALAAWEGPLPPEMLALGVRPVAWRVEDVLAVEKVMAWDLAEYDIGLTLAGAAGALDADAYSRVVPRWPEGGTTILEGDGPGPRDPSHSGASDGVAPGSPPLRPVPPGPSPRRSAEAPFPGVSAATVAAARIPASARPFLEAASVARASNAWVVGGGRSRSGKPLLANDMHLGLSAPPVWYLVGLHAPGLDVVGMSIPGTPGVVAGHSAAVAWGFSNAMVDDVDFFVERPDPADSTRYLVPGGGSEPFGVRNDSLVVRGRDRAVPLRVRTTRHGPVISDAGAGGGGEPLALRWVALDGTTTSRGILAMNRAPDLDAFWEGVRDFGNPHQNVVAADTAGRWGYWMAGTVALRRSGRPPLLPVPGWTGEGDWIGVLPFEEHPHALAPARGFVVTANNRQTPGDAAELITAGTWLPPYRAARITGLLEAIPLHDAASLHAIQLDVGSGFAARWRGRAAAAFRAAGRDADADALEAWDGAAPRDATEPVLFWTWWRGVRRAVAASLYGSAGGYYPDAALERDLEAGRVGDEVLASAARDAAEAAPWGDVHAARLDHPLAGVPVLGRLVGFGRDGIPVGGDGYTPNVADFDGAGDRLPLAVRWGPSQRHVVDLADLDGAGGFVLPGGQSGLPGNDHAFDQLALWRDGGLVPLPMSRAAVEARTATRLLLEPAPPPEG